VSAQNDGYPSAEYEAANRAQAEALKPEASRHGLRFEAYFSPSVAEWVLEKVVKGHFLHPSADYRS